MIEKHKRGQLQGIAAVERSLGDLERAVIITGVGLAQCESLRAILAGLRDATEQAIPEPAAAPLPKKSKRNIQSHGAHALL